MSEIRVRVDVATLQRTGNGTVTGTLFVSGDDLDFPQSGWTDLPVRVLSMWLDALAGAEQEMDEVNGVDAPSGPWVGLPFMDGPYLLRLYKEDDIPILDAIDEHLPATVVARWLVDETALHAEVLRAARIVLLALGTDHDRSTEALRAAVMRASGAS